MVRGESWVLKFKISQLSTYDVNLYLIFEMLIKILSKFLIENPFDIA